MIRTPRYSFRFDMLSDLFSAIPQSSTSVVPLPPAKSGGLLLSRRPSSELFMVLHQERDLGMTKAQIPLPLRHTATDSQKHDDHDELANLRAAVKGVDFEH